jgi:Spy/CpxP family protein refolding chaperone
MIALRIRTNKHIWIGRLLLIGAVLLPSPLDAERVKWWQLAEVQRALHLNAGQVAALDRIFDDSLPERRALLRVLEKLELEFEQLLKEPTLDERVAVELIDRLEAARARRNVARAMLLLRMRHVLTPAQRTALDTVAPRRQAATQAQ